MLRINDTIFSFDILEKKIQMQPAGMSGQLLAAMENSGAPLSADEAIFSKIYTIKVLPNLRPEGIAAISEKGTASLF